VCHSLQKFQPRIIVNQGSGKTSKPGKAKEQEKQENQEKQVLGKPFNLPAFPVLAFPAPAFPSPCLSCHLIYPDL
jgi:hypothetical protein